jgi:hypothetical protein
VAISTSSGPSSGWADQLRAAVLWPGNRWTIAETTSVLLAARELRAGSAIVGRTTTSTRRAGVPAIADFLHSARRLGLHAQCGHALSCKDAAGTTK